MSDGELVRQALQGARQAARGLGTLEIVDRLGMGRSGEQYKAGQEQAGLWHVGTLRPKL